MSKNEEKMVAMAIRKALPESWSYSQKCQMLEALADEYRKKSRKDVYGSSKIDKGIDYTPIVRKDAS